MLTDDQLLNLCDKVHGLEDVSDRACLEYARHVIDALRAQADAEPLFYYRPCGEDGLYEGPVHANSVSGKMLRAAKREEWKPLYTHPSLPAAQGLSDVRIRVIKDAVWAECEGFELIDEEARRILSALDGVTKLHTATVAEPSIQHAPGDWWDEAAALHAEWSSETMPVAATELGKRTAAFIGDCIARAQAAQQQAEPVADYSEVRELLVEAGLSETDARKAANALFPRVTLSMVQQLRDTQKLLDESTAYFRQQQAEPVGDERAAFEEWARTADMPLGMYSAIDYADGATQLSWDAWQARAAQQQAEPESVIKRQAQKIGELIADRDSWIEAHARLYRLYHDQSPRAGEEIHVNVEGGDVYTLPLQLSGMEKPRFVVHVPCSPQAEPGADERAVFEAAHQHLDLTMGPDAWGRPAYVHSHVEAMWAGWQARAAQSGQRAGVTDDMRAAVRFAPSSAHWSQKLVEFFGPDAREGINALEKQLREALAGQRAGVAEGWQPIDTAPTDGTNVLLLATRGRMLYANSRPMVGRFSRGWWGENTVLSHVTHWQPLPAAPTQQQEQQEGK